MDSTRQQFEKSGMRCTQQRMALYEALMECKSHPTADELFHTVQPRVGGLSLATVYNSLEAFSEAGMCLKLPTTSGSVRYDGDTSDHLHVRFHDTDKIADVPSRLGQKLLDNVPQSVLSEIEKEMGVKIEGMQIQLVGKSAKSLR